MVTGSMCAPASILGRQKNRDRRMDRWFNGRANTAFHGFDTSDWTLAWVHYRSILLLHSPANIVLVRYSAWRAKEMGRGG